MEIISTPFIVDYDFFLQIILGIVVKPNNSPKGNKVRKMDPAVTQRLNDLAISESGFLFDPYTGSTYTLNKTGRLILELLKKGKEIEEIQFALQREFAVGDADLRTDIFEFVNLLKEDNLLPRSFSL